MGSERLLIELTATAWLCIIGSLTTLETMMKTRWLLLLILSGFLASCSHYDVKSAQNNDLPCYSTWHWYPKNS